jgi:hypothetical protein
LPGGFPLSFATILIVIPLVSSRGRRCHRVLSRGKRRARIAQMETGFAKPCEMSG